VVKLAYCPILRLNCHEAWECGRCRLLRGATEELRIPEESIGWVCPDCMDSRGPKRDRYSRLHEGEFSPAGYYGSGGCFECGKYSTVLQMVLDHQFIERWKEVLRRAPKTEKE